MANKNLPHPMGAVGELQDKLYELGIRRSADTQDELKLFHDEGSRESVTETELWNIRREFYKSHPDWTWDDVLEMNLVGLCQLPED